MFISQYSLQKATSFISSWDSSSDFVCFTISIIYYSPQIFKAPNNFDNMIFKLQYFTYSSGSPILYQFFCFFDCDVQPYFFSSLLQFFMGFSFFP
jgi:hypothetical protein